MIHLLDANLLLAATLGQHAHHPAAKSWIDQLSDDDSFCFCRATEQAFLRLLTQLSPPGGAPLSNAAAVAAYGAWRADARCAFRPEPSNLGRLWPSLASRNTSSPKLWMDAYLAAFAVADGLTLVTFDKAFRQFEYKGLALRLLM